MGHGLQIKCRFPDCSNTVEGNRWAKTKAHEKGWMFQKNGKNWCPEHLPDWVVEWRAKQALLKGEEDGTGGNEGQAGS